MPYTSLHRAVDARSVGVTAEMVVDAVDLHLAETDDLDWKKDKDEVGDNREVAKDFAAMANSGGGLIVIGVEEDGHDRAARLTGLDEARAQQIAKKYRDIASALIRPFIPALRVSVLETASGPRVVVVEVPRSPEAPHLVIWEQMLFLYARRVSSASVWLGESDIEVAYATRFRLRYATGDRLEQMAAGVQARLIAARGRVWVTVTSTCTMPGPDDGPDNVVQPFAIDDDFRAIYERLPLRGLLRTQLTTISPRPGLRRRIFSSPGEYRGSSEGAHIEMFLDGSFAGAVANTSTATPPGCFLLPQLAQESGVRDLTLMAVEHARARNADGIIQIRVGVHCGAPVGLGFRGALDDEPLNEVRVRDAEPVFASATLAELAASRDAFSTLVRQLLLDMVHQFAVADLVTR